MRRLSAVLLAVLLPACSTARKGPEVPAPEAAAAADSAAEAQAPKLPAFVLAGARVASVDARPSAAELTRGDTATVELVFRDAEGARITGVRSFLAPLRPLAWTKPIGDSLPNSFRVWGLTPGEGDLDVWVAAPTETGTEGKKIGTVPVRVKEWPAARIELGSPGFGTYAGSTFRLTGRVITTHGTEHATARLKWSSSGPEVVAVDPEGVARFKSPGRAQIRAEAEGLTGLLDVRVRRNPVRAVTIQPVRVEARTGDVVQFGVNVTDSRRRQLRDVHVAYSTRALEGPESGAEVYANGGFVAEKPGVYEVIATAGGRAASAVVVASPRGGDRSVKLVGRGPVAHITTSDLWVFTGRDGRDYAYTGTHALAVQDGELRPVPEGGHRMYVWDVTAPASPVLTDSVVVDARVVNDVKVNPEATIAVITREGASNRKNGIVILDIEDPAHPVILSEFTDSLTAGVHNTWINGDVVYAVNDGTNALHIVDISDPAHPAHVGRWEVRPGKEGKYLHDVWAKDGFAYLSYWNDGLVILDVGAGIRGGTAREPKLVAQYTYDHRAIYGKGPLGGTHTAYRYGKYVFVGDEVFECERCVNGPRGYVHVLDVSDIENPQEVARFEVPEAGAHNVWVEDDRLYVAYYQGGLRVVDVSGELRGDLYAQGRQIAWYHSAGKQGEAIRPNAPMAWGPQPHKGYIFFSDMNSGLWVVQLEPRKEPLVP